MIKTISLALLLLITTNTYSQSATDSLGIDLNQAMQLLKADTAKPAQNKACILPGKVIRVVDGDTVYVLDSNKKQHNIRLAGIDAPERGQPYNKAATKFLKKMIAGKNVCVEWYKKDRYKRLVGVVFYNNKDINYQMVLNGYAWHFKKFEKEQKPSDRVLYATAQTNSRLSVIGLWQEPDPITPDDWRAGVRPVKKAARKMPRNNTLNLTSTTNSFSCSGKRFCGHMESCAEACHYLTQCGVGRLDRDKDGIPCESICNSTC